jgi:hypothetical protein
LKKDEFFRLQRGDLILYSREGFQTLGVVLESYAQEMHVQMLSVARPGAAVPLHVVVYDSKCSTDWDGFKLLQECSQRREC